MSVTESSIAEWVSCRRDQTASQTDGVGDSRLSLGFVCPSWPAGEAANGIVSYYSAMAPALEALGCRVTILAHEFHGDRPDDRVIEIQEASRRRGAARRLADAVEYRLNRSTGWERPIQRALVETIHKACSKRGIQILQMEESFGWARAAIAAAPVPVCVRLHGPWFLNGAAMGAAVDDAFRRRVAAEGAAIRAARFATAPSLDVLERVRAYYRLPLRDAAVIPSTASVPPDQAVWRLDDCDPDQILFVGRFDRMKGGDLMIDAFARVLRERPTTRLCFVGPDGGWRSDTGDSATFSAYLDQRIPGALDSGRVAWLGRQTLSKIARLRSRSIATVVCSRYETFSNTTLEAAAAGCPIVAADIGGIPSIIEHGRSALLHRPGDARDLADKLLILLQNPAQAARLGRHARADYLARLQPRIVAQRGLDFFRRVIALHESRQPAAVATRS